MILVMDCIQAQMRVRPRYWKRLFSVLIATCQGDISAIIIQVYMNVKLYSLAENTFIILYFVYFVEMHVLSGRTLEIIAYCS